jgi:hypothetical protein
MARFNPIKRGNKKNSKLSYSTYYSSNRIHERNDNDMYFLSQVGDRCDNLANQFYGDPSLWWFVARINHLNSMNIPIGTHLRIPVNGPNQY